MTRFAYLCSALLSGSAFCISLQAQEAPRPAVEPTYVISGVVMRAKQPLKHVRMTIAQVDHPDREVSLITAEDGTFRFINVPRDKYRLSAEYHGEERMYQQTEAFSTAIATGPSLDSEHLVFDFPPAASIAVKVMDDEGDPAPQCQLYLFHRIVAGGWPKLVAAQNGTTDSAGEHHFTGLEPGTYYLAVTGRPWYANQPSMQFGPDGPIKDSHGKLDLAFPLTYYPGSLEFSSAAPLNVTAGTPLPLQFTLHAVPAVHVTENAPDGQNGRQRSMLIVEANGPAGIPLRLNAQTYSFNGQTSLVGLAPGDYRLSSVRVNQQADMPRRREVESSIEMHLTGDVNATSELAQGSGAIHVSGHLTVAGAKIPDGLRVLLSAIENGQSSLCPVASDGSFSCGNRTMAAGIIPARYEVRLAGAADLYLKSVAVKGAEFAAGLLDVRTGSTADLSLEAAHGLTKLEGIVKQNGHPVAGAMVLLLPQDASPVLQVPRDQSDSDGTFTLPDARPGRYWLLALDDGRELPYQDRTLMKPYLSQARNIEIPLAKDTPLEVQLQKR